MKIGLCTMSRNIARICWRWERDRKCRSSFEKRNVARRRERRVRLVRLLAVRRPSGTYRRRDGSVSSILTCRAWRAWRKRTWSHSTSSSDLPVWLFSWVTTILLRPTSQYDYSREWLRSFFVRPPSMTILVSDHDPSSSDLPVWLFSWVTTILLRPTSQYDYSREWLRSFFVRPPSMTILVSDCDPSSSDLPVWLFSWVTAILLRPTSQYDYSREWLRSFFVRPPSMTILVSDRDPSSSDLPVWLFSWVTTILLASRLIKFHL